MPSLMHDYCTIPSQRPKVQCLIDQKVESGPRAHPGSSPRRPQSHCSARAGTPPRGPPRPEVRGARCARGAGVTAKAGGTVLAPRSPAPDLRPPLRWHTLRTYPAPPHSSTAAGGHRAETPAAYKRPDLGPFAPRILGSTFAKRTSPKYWGALSVMRSGMAEGGRSEFSSLFK